MRYASGQVAAGEWEDNRLIDAQPAPAKGEAGGGAASGDAEAPAPEG